jgi:hypothetical protein
MMMVLKKGTSSEFIALKGRNRGKMKAHFCKHICLLLQYG